MVLLSLPFDLHVRPFDERSLGAGVNRSVKCNSPWFLVSVALCSFSLLVVSLAVSGRVFKVKHWAHADCKLSVEVQRSSVGVKGCVFRCLHLFGTSLRSRSCTVDWVYM